MTNEEAREQIDNLRAHCSDMARSAFTGGEVLWAKDVEALTQAIKALAQEPKTDIRECKNCKHSKDGYMAGTEECHECMWESKQEPKTGHWNTYKLRQGGIDEEWLECSECMWSNALLIPRNYCPNCGARMNERRK